MSRRSASLARGLPHIPHESEDAPGCCVHCGRPMDARNDMHVTELPGVDPAVRTEEARRLGEVPDT